MSEERHKELQKDEVSTSSDNFLSPFDPLPLQKSMTVNIDKLNRLSGDHLHERKNTTKEGAIN